MGNTNTIYVWPKLSHYRLLKNYANFNVTKEMFGFNSHVDMATSIVN